MTVYLPAQVTEREPDGSWEDCTWATGVMLENALAGHTERPPTRAEYEALRVAGGDGPAEHPGDGSNYWQLQTGMRLRYQRPTIVEYGLPFSEAWALFAPGTYMGWQGSMATTIDRYRRWDPGFRGAHSVFAVRVDGQDRAWWMNPEAPPTFPGEWISKTQLLAYYAGLTNPGIIMEGTMQIPVTDETPKLITLAAGTTWYDLDGKTVVSPGAGHSALGLRESPCARGAFREMFATVKAVRRTVLVHAATVVPVPLPNDTTPFAQVDLDNAKAAEHERVRAAAIKAAEAL